MTFLCATRVVPAVLACLGAFLFSAHAKVWIKKRHLNVFNHSRSCAFPRCCLPTVVNYFPALTYVILLMCLFWKQFFEGVMEVWHYATRVIFARFLIPYATITLAFIVCHRGPYIECLRWPVLFIIIFFFMSFIQTSESFALIGRFAFAATSGTVQ